VRRLRGGVHDDRDVLPVPAEDLAQRGAVADVHVVVGVRVAQLAGQPQHVPRRGRLRPEEPRAHVVVDADHVQPQRGEVPYRLRPDQAG
jgi:hypothetical protein